MKQQRDKNEAFKYATSFIGKLIQYILEKANVGLVRLKEHPEYLNYFHQIFPKSDGYKMRQQAYEHFLSLLEVITLATLTVLSLSNIVSIIPSLIFIANICILASLIPLALQPLFTIYNAIKENQKINRLEKGGIINLSSRTGGMLDRTFMISKLLDILEYQQTLKALEAQFSTPSTLLSVLKNALSDDNFQEEAALSKAIQQALLPQYFQDSQPDDDTLKALIAHYPWLETQSPNKEPETNTKPEASKKIETIWENYCIYTNYLHLSTNTAFCISNQIIQNKSLLPKLENDTQLLQLLAEIKDLQERFVTFKAAQRNNPTLINAPLDQSVLDQRKLQLQLYSILQKVELSILTGHEANNRTTSMAAQNTLNAKLIEGIRQSFNALASLLPQFIIQYPRDTHLDYISNRGFFAMSHPTLLRNIILRPK